MNRPRTSPSQAWRAGWVALLLLWHTFSMAAGNPATVRVVFAVEGLRQGETVLTIAVFRPSSTEWGKRFKRIDLADFFCKMGTDGELAEQLLACDLPPDQFIGLVFADTDRNGTLTHGLLGPTEQFGLTGIERAVNFPPDPARTVIDVRRSRHFKVVLN
jgi:uncharacterized protein (DUF2141 family)